MAKLKALPKPATGPDDDDDDDHECQRCPPVGAPAWMATFADIATLLMAFFVLILSFANFDEVSFKKMTGALREHFGTSAVEIFPNPQSTTIIEMDFRPASTPPSPTDSPDPREEEAMQQLTEALKQAMADGEITVAGENGSVTLRLPEGAGAAEMAEALAQAAQDIASPPGQPQSEPAPEPGPEGQDSQQSGGQNAEARAAIADARLKVALQEMRDQGLVDVQQENDKVIVTVGAGGAFGSGSADLTAEARDIMARIALSAAGEQTRITVTGHTDSVPLTGGAFTDNWGLAAARASSVVRELGAQGALDPSQLTAVSRGESMPVADNATEEGRSANRRIEIEFDFADP